MSQKQPSTELEMLFSIMYDDELQDAYDRLEEFRESGKFESLEIAHTPSQLETILHVQHCIQKHLESRSTGY